MKGLLTARDSGGIVVDIALVGEPTLRLFCLARARAIGISSGIGSIVVTLRFLVLRRPRETGGGAESKVDWTF